MARQKRMARSYYLEGNVYDAALARMRWLYDEFDGNLAVSFSGGKDSTVTLQLALIVARERSATPLKVFWLDQECEFRATVEYVEKVAAMPDVDFHWYQIPFRLFNATSSEHPWLNVWGEGEEWARERHPSAITENDFGTDRFARLCHAIGDRLVPGGVVVTGMRLEESPARRAGLTTAATHRWATWGSKAPANHTIMHPIYDWTYKDIWKAIHDGGWDYNEMYDYQYRYGVPPRSMRVSNYHHETAVHSLFWLQEIEPDTWSRAIARVNGISTAGHLGKEDFFVRELPYMFRSWIEYRDYLLEHLPASDEDRETFRRQFSDMDKRLADDIPEERRARVGIQSLISNDIEGTKIDNFISAQGHRKRPPQDLFATAPKEAPNV